MQVIQYGVRWLGIDAGYSSVPSPSQLTGYLRTSSGLPCGSKVTCSLVLRVSAMQAELTSNAKVASTPAEDLMERAGRSACYKARRGALRKAVMSFVSKPATRLNSANTGLSHSCRAHRSLQKTKDLRRSCKQHAASHGAEGSCQRPKQICCEPLRPRARRKVCCHMFPCQI